LSQHRFDLGQTVVAVAKGIPTGPYVIIRKLPLVGTEPHYHAKSERGTIRAILESQIAEFTANGGDSDVAERQKRSNSKAPC
jgi:hypothetical protein